MRKTSIILAVGIVAAAVGALIGFGDGYPAAESGAASVPAGHPPVATGAPHPIQVPGADQGAGKSLDGEVLETISVQNYTYLRLRTASGETWAAVPQTAIAKGARVRVLNINLMSNFHSPSLKRTFETIYFGVLDKAAGGSPHGPAASSAAKTSASGEPVKPGDVAPAKGDDARTVEQVFKQRKQLTGKRVRLRAVVVKAVPGVMGRNWLHLQDGSGDATARTNDLVATTQATAQVGQTVLVTAVVATDKDFGSGYRYDVLLEQAELAVEP